MTGVPSRHLRAENPGRFPIRAHPTIHPPRLLQVAVGAAIVGMLAFVAVPAGASSSGRYQVRRGDTLSEIASRLGVSVSGLVSTNDLDDPDLVMAGTWLTVPGGASARSAVTSSGGSTYRVQAGDNLSAIAARYGLATITLADANGITDPNVVQAGTRLTIPSDGGSSGSSSSSGSSGSYVAGTSSLSGSHSLPLRLRESPSRLAYLPTFQHWAAVYGVPADLLEATTWLESGWQMGVVSSTGAVGIGQLEPSTVVTVNRLLGTSLSPWVPSENIRMSARYLETLLAMTGGDSARTLAGYYQGLASVQRNGLYPSTLAYVDGVEALRQRFR